MGKEQRKKRCIPIATSSAMASEASRNWPMLDEEDSLKLCEDVWEGYVGEEEGFDFGGGAGALSEACRLRLRAAAAGSRLLYYAMMHVF